MSKWLDFSGFQRWSHWTHHFHRCSWYCPWLRSPFLEGAHTPFSCRECWLQKVQSSTLLWKLPLLKAMPRCPRPMTDQYRTQHPGLLALRHHQLSDAIHTLGVPMGLGWGWGSAETTSVLSFVPCPSCCPFFLMGFTWELSLDESLHQNPHVSLCF